MASLERQRIPPLQLNLCIRSIPTRRMTASGTDIDPALRRYRPGGGCDTGPLMTGACAGGGSGAGIRFSKAGTCGGGSTNKGADPRQEP